MTKQIKSSKKKTIVIVVIVSLAVVIPIMYLIHYSSAVIAAPLITKDPNLKAELVFQGLSNPTSMAFLGPNDILVLEKDQVTVQRIVNGNMLGQPILSANVATEGERGMLGIAIAKHGAAMEVRLYFFIILRITVVAYP